jgi:hypothetical protein
MGKQMSTEPPRILFILFLVGLASGLLAAQESIGSLIGSVTDPSGAAVSNAKITLVNNTTNATETATTGPDGSFRFVNLTLGDYKLRVSCPGFLVKERFVRIAAGQAASLAIVLSLGSSYETIEVSGNGEGGGPRVSEYSAPVWNAWAEDFSPTTLFTPVATLQPRTDYNVVLDLSGLSYGEGQGLYSQKVGKDLRVWLKNAKGQSAYLDVLIQPDQGAFETQRDSEKSKVLLVDLKRASQAQNKIIKVKGQPFDILRRNPSPPFVFGRVTARVRTTAKLGPASIALMLWSNGRPVDELSLPLCVSDGSVTCESAGRVAVTLNGIDSLRIAAAGSSSPFPNAALHLIQLDSSHLVGVFKCNSCTDPQDQSYKTWQIDGTAEQFSAYLSGTNLFDFENSTTDAEYLQHGQELYLKLFRDGPTGQLAPAEANFRKFILQNTQSPKSPAPSIFVRLLPGSTAPLFLVPLGLMAVPDTEYYIGRYFRIETPFETQSYDAPPACISQWVLLVPPDSPGSEDPMQKVREPVQGWISSFAGWKDHAVVYSNLTDFTTWLRGKKAKAGSSAVLILSHHDLDRIYFQEGQQAIESANVLRPFARPSLVILNGCGTAKPGASDFLRSFNRDGVPTAVATSYAVDAHMAGLFAARLLDHLAERSKDASYGIGKARFDAMQDVGDAINPDTKQPYGPRALVFTLVGDGSVRVCLPPPVTK